jgi:hypothetical protein
MSAADAVSGTTNDAPMMPVSIVVDNERARTGMPTPNSPK